MPVASSRRVRSPATPRPGKAAASRQKGAVTFWWLPLAVRTMACLGILVLLAVVTSLLMNGGFEDPDPQSKILRLSDQDIDPETTNLTKTLLRQNQSDQRIGLYLWAKAADALSADALSQVKSGLAHGQIAQPLSSLAKSLADDLDQQKVAAFTLWFVPNDEAASGAVRLQLDGVDLGEFPVGSERYSITLLAKTGSMERLQITATQTHAGPIVYRAETATTAAVTRRLALGKSDSWSITVQ
ncbi:MAG TPA: hypothetical protein VFO40_25590 [Chthoniobacterales bacterium]|nr:hypothetical protein [Chthoniobacterales bacterium]